jgi:hypothetical protein
MGQVGLMNARRHGTTPAMKRGADTTIWTVPVGVISVSGPHHQK